MKGGGVRQWWTQQVIPNKPTGTRTLHTRLLGFKQKTQADEDLRHQENLPQVGHYRRHVDCFGSPINLH